MAQPFEVGICKGKRLISRSPCATATHPLLRRLVYLRYATLQLVKE